MIDQGKNSGLVPQVWFVIAMLVAALGLLGGILWGAPQHTEKVRALVRIQFEHWQARATERQATRAAQALTPKAPTVAAEGKLSTPAWPTPTPYPIPTRRPPEALRQDHYWLERPIAPPGNSAVARFYPYGSRLDGSYPIHHGVEMVNPAGTPVRAPAAGVVVVAGSDESQVYGARPGFYGLLVILELDQRYRGMPIYVLMGHLSEVHVSVGQHVSAGETLGLVGQSGYAEAPHLHTEVRLGRNDYFATVNPELWYRPREGYGTLAGLLMTKDGQVVDSEAKLVLRRGGVYTYEVFTYPPQQVNPDPEWGENFCIGDLEAGAWSVEVFWKGKLYTYDVIIEAGKTTWLVMQVD